MKKNLYLRTETAPNEAIEVFIGQNAGKQLNNDIQNAQKEVLIISPYISENNWNNLFYLKKYKNINVKVAFSDWSKQQVSEKRNVRILKKLIQQNQYTNTSEKQRKKKLEKRFILLSYFSWFLGIILVILTLIKTIISTFQLSNIYIFITSFLCFFLFKWFQRKKINAQKIPIYTYDYSKKIDFKYLRNNNKMFVHSKIYIIDRQIAYLGSLNFTDTGFSSNFETRVRITQKDKINELVNFVNTIFDDDQNFKKHELSFLGRKVYYENKY